tara:strand:- start:458 stop:1114 length:657 start_codon:yes stop_codon:yes gene_type:complete
MSHRIVLIHAVPMAIEPIKCAFDELWPEPEIVNLFDDSLSIDRAKSNVLTTDMERRIADLGNYAESIGADGILFTCSAFGPAIDKVINNLTIPVLKPNEAMFEQALNTGHRIGMLATFEQSIASMSKEFCEVRNTLSATGYLDAKLVKGAMEFLRQGNQAKHNELIAKTAATFQHCDVLMLAQFSMVSAKSAVFKELNVPVLTAPEAAVKKLRGILMQ